MPRRKIAMTFIEGRRARAATYARRSNGIKKKAKELAKLCGARVAIVCAAGAGAGAKPLEWESEEGVLDSYRALPPEIRAQHTLRDHLEAELDKERAKLARVQQHGPAALADMGAALGDDMTLAQARELLEAIDASLRATRRRMRALGLPADGPLEQIVEDAAMPHLGHDNNNGLPCIGGNGGDMDAGFQLQMAPPSAAGENGNAGPWLEEFSWDDRFQMHNASVTQPGFGFQMHDASMAQPGFGGFPCTVGDYLGAGQMQAPGYGNARYYVCSDLTMCHDNGVLPVGYYYPSLGMDFGGHFIDGTAAPEQSAAVSGSGPVPLAYAMGMGGDLTSLGSYTGYWRSDQDFQRADANASTSHGHGRRLPAASPQNSTPGTSSSSKAFRYL